MPPALQAVPALINKVFTWAGRVGPALDAARQCYFQSQAAEYAWIIVLIFFLFGLLGTEGSDAVDLEYDSRNPFVLCALSMVPIYKGSPSISCPYCAAKYLPEHAGKPCAVCKAGKIGGQGAGLLISRKYNAGRRR